MRILQCVREIKAAGGVSGVACCLEQEFLKAGHQVDRFTLESISQTTLPGSGSTSLIRQKLKLLRDVVRFSILGTRKLRQESAVGRHDIVICHNDVVYGDVYVNHGLHRAMLYRSKHPIRMLLRNPLHAFLLVREWIRFSSSAHRRVVCFCASEADLLLQNYPNTKVRIEVIPNGVDIDRFTPSPVIRTQQRNGLNIGEDEFVALFIGHEFDRKGLDLAVKALQFVPEQVKLVVVGGGGSDQAIGKYKTLARNLNVEKRVIFLGTRSDMQDVINMADVFVLPTHFESWALVGLEAMACAVPAIMTPTGGITEYLKDGVNGFIVRHDAKDIANRINALRSDPAMLDSMRREARKTALGYSWTAVANRYLKLFAEVILEKQRNA